MLLGLERGYGGRNVEPAGGTGTPVPIGEETEDDGGTPVPIGEEAEDDGGTPAVCVRVQSVVPMATEDVVTMVLLAGQLVTVSAQDVIVSSVVE